MRGEDRPSRQRRRRRDLSGSEAQVDNHPVVARTSHVDASNARRPLPSTCPSVSAHAGAHMLPASKETPRLRKQPAQLGDGPGTCAILLVYGTPTLSATLPVSKPEPSHELPTMNSLPPSRPLLPPPPLSAATHPTRPLPFSLPPHFLASRGEVRVGAAGLSIEAAFARERTASLNPTRPSPAVSMMPKID